MEKLEEQSSVLNEFDKWRNQQSPEQLKEFYKNLEEVNNSQDEWLKFKCKKMNKLLEPIYNANEYDCNICHNSGAVYKIVIDKKYKYKYIELFECECVKKRNKKGGTNDAKRRIRT